MWRGRRDPGTRAVRARSAEAHAEQTGDLDDWLVVADRVGGSLVLIISELGRRDRSRVNCT